MGSILQCNKNLIQKRTKCALPIEINKNDHTSNPLPTKFSLELEKVQCMIHKLRLIGKLERPASFRLFCLDENGKSEVSESFFIDFASQSLKFDSLIDSHDPWGPGRGILIKDSHANDEYINHFLPLCDHINKELGTYFSESQNDYSITDKQSQKDSIYKREELRLKIRKSSDSLLYEYANKYPKSPISSWVLYDAAFHHSYSDYYSKRLTK